MMLKALFFNGWIEPLTKRVWRHLVAEQETVCIPLNRGQVCVECEMIHQANRCPRCLGTAAVSVRKTFVNLEKALAGKLKRTTPKGQKSPAIPSVKVARIENGRKKYVKMG